MKNSSRIEEMPAQLERMENELKRLGVRQNSLDAMTLLAFLKYCLDNGVGLGRCYLEEQEPGNEEEYSKLLYSLSRCDADGIEKYLPPVLQSIDRVFSDQPIFSGKTVRTGIESMFLPGVSSPVNKADWLSSRFARLDRSTAEDFFSRSDFREEPVGEEERADTIHCEIGAAISDWLMKRYQKEVYVTSSGNGTENADGYGLSSLLYGLIKSPGVNIPWIFGASLHETWLLPSVLKDSHAEPVLQFANPWSLARTVAILYLSGQRRLSAYSDSRYSVFPEGAKEPNRFLAIYPAIHPDASLGLMPRLNQRLRYLWNRNWEGRAVIAFSRSFVSRETGGFGGFREGRENMIADGHIRAIISLPANLDRMPAGTCLFLLTSEESDQILFVDAAVLAERTGRRVSLSDSAVGHILDVVDNMRTEPGFSACVPFEEIEEKNYVLLPSLYIAPKIQPRSSTDRIEKELEEAYRELFRLAGTNLN